MKSVRSARCAANWACTCTWTARVFPTPAPPPRSGRRELAAWVAAFVERHALGRVVSTEPGPLAEALLASLDDTERDRTVVAIDRLAELGSTARMPFSRALGDGLFELRFTLGPTARRITYRFTTNNRIILLTTFRKQRNNERAEIARARKIAETCARLNP